MSSIFAYFFARSIEKKVFFFLHPFNTLFHWRRLYRQWKVETCKNLDAVMRQRSTSTPSRDIQMGFSFSSFFLSCLFSLCKHLSGYICILFRFVCTRNRRREGRERENSLFLLKNGICYALIKWRCCTFILRLVEKSYRLSCCRIPKPREEGRAGREDEKIIG